MDQCDTCSYYRSRYYEATPVGECRFNAPVAQGQHMQWPEVQVDDWCADFEPIGGSLNETYVNGNLALTTTSRVKLMDVGGDLTYTALAIFGCQVTDLANQAVVVFFYDGDTTNMITQAGSIANGSNEVNFGYPPVALTGEVWCALSTALTTVYVSAQGRKVRP